MATRPSRIRPYKDFLTPAMHRQFARSLACLMLLCYVVACLLGDWNSYLWAWFPLGLTGLRTWCLFFAVAPILILRIARLHVGWRTSNSGFESFLQHGLQYRNLAVLGVYAFSAWFFCEIYFWSIGGGADLCQIKQGPQSARPVLNEKPIYLRSFMYCLAITQTWYHLYYDYDRIEMPVTKTKPTSSSDQRPHLTVSADTLVRSKLFDIARSALTRSVTMALCFPFLYSIELPILPFVYSFRLRIFAWKFTRTIVSIFRNLPKSGALPSSLPYHWRVILASAFAGFMLISLWELGNTALSAYVAQEPLKNERPITYESRDPNASLIMGLTAKKLHTRVFAFWELLYIAQRFEGRRRAIYEDIDLPGGSAWSQILRICLGVVNGMNQRIQDYEKSSIAQVDAGDTTVSKGDIPGLPRLVPALRERPGGIFATSPPLASKGANAANVLEHYAKAHGQSPLPESNIWQKTAPLYSMLEARFQENAALLLNTRIGAPFRQEYRRRIGGVIMGTPYGEVSIIVDAIDALTRFAVCSLVEDTFGNVQRDIRLIIQTFTMTINSLERLQQTFHVHWTDVKNAKGNPELDTILAALKGDLQELLDAFKNYIDELSLNRYDIKQAKAAAAIPMPASKALSEPAAGAKPSSSTAQRKPSETRNHIR